MSGPLAARRALVTGASRGIGRAVAASLAGAGARVALVARGVAPLEAAAAAVGGVAVPGDVSEARGLAELVRRAAERLGGPPDIVVHAAGAFALQRVVESDVAELDAMLGANLRGPFLLTRALLPALLEQGRGDVVFIGSVAGRRAFPENGAYSATKFGVRGLHEVLAEELRGSGVRTTLIEPAATDTPLWDPVDPDARPHLPSRSAMLRPEAVAEAVLWALTRPPEVRVDTLAIERA
ncbi:MAG: SDR family oxidoreductase [Gemmatimonadota bacterium]